MLTTALGVTSCASSRQQSAREAFRSTSASYNPATVDPADSRFSSAGNVALGDSAGLYDILRYAGEHNPQVAAAYHRWQAALERIPQATALPDPKLKLGYYFEQVETRVGPQEYSVGLAQTFPWFGTLQLKGDVAAAAAQIAAQEFAAARDRLFHNIVAVWANYYHLQRSRLVTAEVLELLKDAEAVAEAKYRGGDGLYADVIRGQIELGRLEDRLLALDAKDRVIAAQLNAALNRPVDAALPVPVNLPEEVLQFSDDEIRTRVRANNPGLRALDFAWERAERTTALAGKRGYPSLSFGVDYIGTGPAMTQGVPGSGTDPLIGRFSINIPLWRGSYKAAQREGEARQRAVARDRANRENQLSAATEGALFDYHDANRTIDLYRDALIPKAYQSVQASRTGYEAGAIDFLDYLDAQRVLLEFELAFDRARADRLTYLAALRVLTGGAFATLQKRVDDNE
jgi:outer membrane protein TolC